MSAHNRIDITGQRFGRLTVIAYSHTKKLRRRFVAMWVARCECGSAGVYSGPAMRKGNTSSCGCLQREKAAVSMKALAPKPDHGLSESPTWNSWMAMRNRCLRPGATGYEQYKDVEVCKEWANDFKAFLADMGARPEGTTLDRIDNSRGYEPGNCRWATHREQGNNRRNNRLITALGRTDTVSNFARLTGLHKDTISHRLNIGWTAERAVTTPSKKNPHKFVRQS